MEAPPSRDTSPFLSSALCVFKDAYSYFKFKLYILFAFLLLVAGLEIVGMGLLLPILYKLGFSSNEDNSSALFDITFLDSGNYTLNALLLLTLGVFLLRTLIQYAIDLYAANLSSQYAANWREGLFEAFTNADMCFFSKHKSATLISSIIREADRVRLSMDQLNQIVKTLFFCLAYFAVAIIASWETCFLLAVFGGLSVLVIKPLSKRADKIGTETYKSFEMMQKHAVEFLQAAKLLKATASEKYARQEISKNIQRVKSLSKQEIMHPYIVQSLFEFLGIFTLISVIFVSVVIMDVSGARMIVALFLFMRIYSRISSIEKFRQSFRIYVTSFFALKSLKEEALERGEKKFNKGDVPYINQIPPSIEVENISLSYGDKKVLHNVSLTVDAGSIIGIAGGSGAGKTSLVDCMLGLCPIEKGNISINTQNLKDLNVQDFRKHVGYVTQQTILFHDTIFNNISWGSDSKNKDDVINAAKMAQAHDFICELPEGYETIIGDDGHTLSGGQRQRLGLARSLMGNKTFLILDETTSALDAKTEADVTKVIENLKGSITTIVITHRLPTLRIADKIYFFESGKLVESGSFSELTEKSGMFDELVRLQETQRA